MPTSLDVLLFWAGVGITVTGLIVFIMGRVKPDSEKQGDNRFEAFGIKIDVSNPSLLLIILGVVLMLVPKMIPQEAREIGDSLISTVQGPATQQTAVESGTVRPDPPADGPDAEIATGSRSRSPSPRS